MNPLMHSGVIPGSSPGYVQEGYGMAQYTQASPLASDVMAYSPYSRGSNSTSPPSHNSPGPYAVKSEPMNAGHHMGGPGHPQLVILEQPQQRFRFRYESELGGTHGQLAGRSGADRRSFPTVKLEGFAGRRAAIRCELFTAEESGNLPPVPHVHTLQGRHCSAGYAEIRVDQENDYTASFQGLGIIHTAKKQMVDKITTRKLNEKKMELESANMGTLWNPTEADKQEAREQANRESQRINMNRVCLRFRALYQNPTNMRMEEICQPVFSGPIFNGKSAQTGELKIVQLSEAFSPCTGNKEIWLLVERVRKNDIKVLVYEEDSNRTMIWCDYGRVIKCHHQYAIIFSTPPYRDKEIRSPVRVFIQLERPSDGCVSEPKHFQYTERDQRTTKRTLMSAETGASDSKRPHGFYLDSEQGRTRVQYPTHDDLRRFVSGYEDINHQIATMRSQHQAPPHPQPQPPQTQAQPQPQQMPPMAHTQSRPQPPQQQQQQQQMPVMQQGYHHTHSPASVGSVASVQSPYSVESVHSPQQQQQQVMENYNSPQHQYQMMSPQQPVSMANPAAPSVDDVLSVPMASGHMPLPGAQMPPVSSMPGVNPQGMGQVGYGGYEPAGMEMLQQMGMANINGQEVLPEMLDQDLMSILQGLPSEALSDGAPRRPGPSQRAPRGVARGAASPGAAAASDSAPVQPSGDQLEEEMRGLSLSAARRGEKDAVDASRPEVQLAYRSADSLYLFAATGDENFLLERYRCLVGMENYDGDNVLHVAAMYQSTKALACLLEAISGLDEEARSSMIDSPNSNRQTPLHIAVLSANVACTQLLLRAGAEILLSDSAGNTAVHLAAGRGTSGVLSALFNQLTQDGDLRRALELANYRGLTPLHVAVQAGHREAARAICKAGADVSAPDDTEGRSPLHLAVQNGDAAMCRMLIKQGATVDALTFSDVTPLHMACKRGDLDLTSLLIARGADPRRRSVERQPEAGSGTESGEDEEREEEEGEEDGRLDAFMYAEMAGDPKLEQILRGRLQLPIDDDDDEDDQQPQQQQQAAAKKLDTDSGMDSGLGITQELTSAPELAAGATGGRRSPDSLPESTVRRLCALLDADGAWKRVAELLELDLETGAAQTSPTRYILRCVQKYENISLDYFAQLLDTLGMTEAQRLVLQHIAE